MFMSRLNDAQRRSFLALTTKMALADGKVKPEEIALLEELAHAFGQDTPILLINSVWRIRLETSYPLSRTMHS